jgi:ubiquinone/menaquinone biosynthesis C-methylase UbiE
VVKALVKQFVPPVIWSAMSALKRRVRTAGSPGATRLGEQSLHDYWDPEMAKILETWGEDSVWIEVQLLLAGRAGRVLDIACGTGKVMEMLSRYPALEVHGFDISDMLIGKAIERGIARERLRVCDATRMAYEKDSFDLAYSIGSLEHFTEDGILQFLHECQRVVAGPTFHQIPVSADNLNQGWIRTFQSYYNNSVDWWLSHFRQVYPKVYVVDSTWSDSISRGKWFVCPR